MKTRTLLIAVPMVTMIALGVIGVDWHLHTPPGEPDSSAYQGTGGTVHLPWATCEVPDLTLPNPDALTAQRNGTATITPQAILTWRGKPLSIATTALGKPTTWRLPDGTWACLWPSAVVLATLDPGQWPTVHVLAQTKGAGATEPTSEVEILSVALVGSLGRVIAADPAEGAFGPGGAPAISSRKIP